MQVIIVAEWLTPATGKSDYNVNSTFASTESASLYESSAHRCAICTAFFEDSPRKNAAQMKQRATVRRLANGNSKRNQKALIESLSVSWIFTAETVCEFGDKNLSDAEKKAIDK